MIVFVVTVFLLVTALQTGNCAEVCQTTSCVKTAARVIESINGTVDPCNDFFEFACGGWITKHPIPPRAEIISTMGLIHEEITTNLRKILEATDKDDDGKPIKLARAMYRTCMDQDSMKKLGMEPLNSALTKLGLPHGPPSDEEAKSLNIPKIAALASRFYGMTIFVDVRVGQNITDSTKNQLTIQQVSPILDHYDVYLRHPRLFNATVQRYRNYSNTIFLAAGVGNKSVEYTEELLNFTTSIVEVMGTPVERVKANYSRGVVTIDELQEITDPDSEVWDWSEFFKVIFEQTDIIVDTMNDTVFANDIDYFVDLTSLLNDTSQGTIARYVWWEISSKYRQVYKPLSRTTRRQACTNIVKSHFDAVLTNAYVKKHFDEQYKKNAIDMWANVISSFDEMITELDWMDADTKTEAHKKVSAVRSFIGYPESIAHPAELEKYYEEWEVLDGRLFDTMMQHQFVRRKKLLNSWRQKPNKNKWVISGTSTAALYIPKMNSVAIPAGILHTPLYGNAVESLNYGAMGTLMGGQLTHSVDNKGRRADDNGNAHQWWRKETLNRYVEKIRCIIKQYSKLVISPLDKTIKLNGRRIQDNGIADIAGLKIAFRAYKKFKAKSGAQQALPAVDKYTDEQLVFLGFAQTWCGSETDVGLKVLTRRSFNPPNHYRVIETLQNSVEFAEVWKCPVGTPMNPEKKCVIW